jgi:hypothetical protein
MVINETAILLRAALDDIGVPYMFENHVRSIIFTGRLDRGAGKWMRRRLKRCFGATSTSKQTQRPCKALVDFLPTTLKSNAKRKKHGLRNVHAI